MKRKIARKTKPARRKPGAKISAKKSAKKSVKKSAKRSTKAKPRHAPPAPAKSDPLDALVASSAEALRLPLDPAWHGSVKFNLGLILRLGALVDEFPLPDDAEPGPVFYA
jgi:hypothetical protein